MAVWQPLLYYGMQGRMPIDQLSCINIIIANLRSLGRGQTAAITASLWQSFH
jgi:hypothetical protein